MLVIRDCLTLHGIIGLKFRSALVCSFETRQVRTRSMKCQWYLWHSSPKGRAAHTVVTRKCVVCIGAVLFWIVSAITLSMIECGLYLSWNQGTMYLFVQKGTSISVWCLLKTVPPSLPHFCSLGTQETRRIQDNRDLWIFPLPLERRSGNQDHVDIRNFWSSLLIVLFKFSISLVSLFLLVQKVHHPSSVMVNLPIFHLVVDIFFLLFLKLILIGVQLLYNVVLVSAVQQSESTIHIHISLLFWISFPFRFSVDIFYFMYFEVVFLGLYKFRIVYLLSELNCYYA